MELHVLTQNTMLKPSFIDFTALSRIPCIVEMIKKCEFDIIGMQEVFGIRAQKSFYNAWKFLSLPDRPIAYESISIPSASNGIPSHCFFDENYPYFVMGPFRAKRSTLKIGGGLVIFSKYPLSKVSSFIFKDKASRWPWVEGWADAWSDKGVLYANVELSPGNGEDCHIHVFVTHTQAGIHNAFIRQEQYKELTSFIAQCTQGDGFPIMLMGDFNVEPDQDYRNLIGNLEELGLCDVWNDFPPRLPTWVGNQDLQGIRGCEPWGGEMCYR